MWGRSMCHGWLVRKASSVRKSKGPAFNSTLRSILLVKNLQIVDHPCVYWNTEEQHH